MERAGSFGNDRAEPVPDQLRQGRRQDRARGLPEGTASQVVPPTPRSQFGSQGTPPPTLYAPFTFLVGNVTIDQFPSLQWNGNLQTVTEGGTEYGAVAVEQVRERSTE